MNLYPIFGFSTKINIVSQNSHFTLKHYISPKSLKMTAFLSTHQLLLNQQFLNLPFLIKLKFTKTIKTTVPTLSYAYILPSNRFTRSNGYIRRLTKTFNQSTFPINNVSTFYSTLLKI